MRSARKRARYTDHTPAKGRLRVFRSREKRATGIQIDGSVLRVVELARAGDVTRLCSLAQEELPAHLTPARLPSDEVQVALAQLVARLGDEQDIRFDRPVLALLPGTYHLKRRPHGRGNERANREHLLWEAEQFVPDDGEEHTIDCALTSNWGFVVAVRQQVLELHADLLTQADVGALDFDIGPFALYNVLEAAELLPTAESQLLVDVVALGVCGLMLRDGELAGAETCSWEHNGEPAAQLAALEQHVGRLLAAGERSSGGPDNTEKPKAPESGELAGETVGESGVQRVWMAGNAEPGSNWSTYLSDRFSADPSPIDPFRNVDTSPVEAAQSALLEARACFAQAMGLALRGLAP